MMKFLVAVAVSAGAAGTAHALVFEVQAPGTAGFQAVTPLSQDRDLAGFYDYDGPLTDRADPAFFAEANVAHFFLYQDSGATGAAALGLGLIVSSAAGGAGSYDFTFSGAPAGASAAVEDDPEDLFGWDAGGDVDGAFEFDWTAGETDGFGIGDLGDLVWTIQITGLGASGIQSFVFLTGNPSTPAAIALGDLSDGMLTIRAAEAPAAVPAPAGLPLLAGALSGFGLLRRRR